MPYDFLVDTYETERLKILSVWSMFQDNDMGIPQTPMTNGVAVSSSRWFTSV